METIWVETTFGATEFGYSDTDELLAELREHLPGVEVDVPAPKGQGGRGPDWWLELARTIYVSIPWDSVGDESVKAVIMGLSAWLGTRIGRQKDAAAKGGDSLMGKPDHYFPTGASSETKEELLRTTPYRVRIFGPGNNLVAIIEQDASMEEPSVTTPNDQRG